MFVDLITVHSLFREIDRLALTLKIPPSYKVGFES